MGIHYSSVTKRILENEGSRKPTLDGVAGYTVLGLLRRRNGVCLFARDILWPQFSVNNGYGLLASWRPPSEDVFTRSQKMSPKVVGKAKEERSKKVTNHLVG